MNPHLILDWNKDLRTILSCASTLALVFFFAGCLHTAPVVLPDNPQSISIPIAVNRTFEYGVEERITDVFVQEFYRDGRLDVFSQEKADLLLMLTVTRYDLHPLSYDSGEQAVSFNLRTDIEVSLKDLRTGKMLAEKVPFSENGVYFLANEPGARREEQVYTRLAEAVISRLLEGW
jgi:hypothetical protein